MLSFGYALLLNDITAAVYRIGLDPAIGFFHVVDYGRPSLALDLEEEFRPVIVDALALSLVRQGLLQPADFRAREEGGPAVLLTDDARRFLIARYEERLAVKVRHPGWDQQLTYRQCIERQVEHMARSYRRAGCRVSAAGRGLRGRGDVGHGRRGDGDAGRGYFVAGTCFALSA